MKPTPTLTDSQMIVLATLACALTDTERHRIVAERRNAFNELVVLGLAGCKQGEGTPEATKRGDYMIKAMALVPLPVEQPGWAMPGWYGGPHPK
jgi:hypothetical protein